MRLEGATLHRAGSERAAERPAGSKRAPLIAAECWRIGLLAAVVVVVALVASGPHAWKDIYKVSDAPFFLGVGKHPFGSGQLPGDPLIYGVSYRYGRVLFPLFGWLTALGRPAWVPGSLIGVYVASFGAWVAIAAEHLRRNGRNPALALWILALPFCLLSFMRPVIVSDPMAGALLLLVYLCERDGRRKAAYVTAALLILTREPMALALLPLVWTGWKERRFTALRNWFLVVLPYLLWIVWVRFRVGQFPFLDPSMSRREALSGPFVGYHRIIEMGASGIQWFAMASAVLTMVVAAGIALRGHWRYPLTHGAITLCALIPFLGVSVFFRSGEALRVLVPIQAAVLIAALDRGGSRAALPEHEPA